MITFVQWAKEIDAAFRAFYPTVALENETVEPEPRRSATHYLLGTARLDAAGRSALAAEFGNDVIIESNFPASFEEIAPS